MSDDIVLSLNNGKLAAAASGLPGELFDRATQGFFFGMSQLFDFAEHRASELNDCLATDLSSPYQILPWYPLTLRSNKMLPLEACSPCEEACGDVGGFVHEIDSRIEGFGFVQNRMTETSVTEMADCQLLTTGERKFLRFKFNPFADTEDLWSITEDSEYGVTFKNLHAWLYQARFNGDYIRRFISPISGLPPNVSLDVQQAVIQLKMYPSSFSFRRLLGLVSSSPVAEQDGVVDEVYAVSDRSRLVVVSGRTYIGHSSLSPVVEEGQSVVAGDRLFNGFDIAELSHEELSWDSEVVLPGSLFGLTDPDTITLGKVAVPVVMESTYRYTFDVGSNSDTFWDYLYAMDSDLVTQLLTLLRGQSSVVPYEFFKQHKLLYGCVAVRLQGSLISDNAAAVVLLKKCLPPHRTLLLTVTDPIPKLLLPVAIPCCVV